MVTPRFFDDGPADGSAEAPDLLGRRRYAEHAQQLLERVRQQSDSGVLAMIGPWGAGKSTVLKMIMQDLREEAHDGSAAGWLVSELNPWMYTDLESLAMALFGELRAALPAEERWSDLRQRIGNFGKAISPLGKIGGLMGVDASGIIDAFSERVRGDVSATEAKHRVEEALRDVDLSILVVMDDVDRLTPQELLLVFKLIRLVGNLPKVYYLISFDEQTLLDVLCRSDLVGSDPRRAAEFLEKIVQVRLDLPAFREQEALAITNQSLDLLRQSHQVELSEGEQKRFSQAYFRHLQDRLTTPRAIKRFFAQADATLGPLVNEVDLCDFLLVTFLRTSEPGVYRLMLRYRGVLTGSAIDREIDRGRVQGHRQEQAEQQWRLRLQHVGVSEEHLTGVLSVLQTLFPAVFQSGGSSEAARRQGVGSVDHFDRYFVFGIPEDDLSERQFDHAVEQIGAGEPGKEREEFLARLRTDTHRIIRRLGHRREQGRHLPAAQLLQVLSNCFGHLNSNPELHGLLTPERRVEVVAGDLLADVQAHEVGEVLENMAATADGARLACAAYYHLTKESGTAERVTPASQYREAQHRLGHRIRDHLAPAGSRSAAALSLEEVRLIWGWWHIHPNGAREWVGQCLDHGAWDVLPLLTRLVPDRSYPYRAIDTDTAEALEFLIGSERLDTELDKHRTPLEDLDPHESHLVQSLRRHRDTEH